MIFDRTQNDVDTAILLRNTKVKNFETLTESDIATLEKGTLTINTINRIENKQEEFVKTILSYKMELVELSNNRMPILERKAKDMIEERDNFIKNELKI